MTNKKFLLISEDNKLYQNIINAIEGIGGQVQTISRLEKNDFAFSQKVFDFVFVDAEVSADTLSCIHMIRKDINFNSCPIFIFSDHLTDDESKKVVLMGADSVLSKNFDPLSLQLMVISFLRRRGSYIQDAESLRYGDVVIHPNDFTVEIKNNRYMLTRTEFNILHKLVSNPQCVISREDLAGCFPQSHDAKERTVDVHINSIRRKLGTWQRSVRTVRGKGYQFLLIEQQPPSHLRTLAI